MFDRYPYIKGFQNREDARYFADLLPSKALAKVQPYSESYWAGTRTLFSVEVDRFFTDPRRQYENKYDAYLKRKQENAQ